MSEIYITLHLQYVEKEKAMMPNLQTELCINTSIEALLAIERLTSFKSL